MFVRRGVLLVASLTLGCILCSCATGTFKVRRTSAEYSKYIKGLLNDRLGQIDEAVDYYHQAQDYDEQVPALHVQLGLDYIRLKKFKESVSEFEKAVRLAPDDDYARYVLALLYIQFNDFKKAAQQYEKLLERSLNDKAQNIQLRRILSQLYFLDEDYASAKKQCEKILQLDPLDASALYFLAMIASEEGETQKAIESFKELLAHYPDDADAMNSLAYIYVEQNEELDKALALSEKAVESEPANGAFLDTLGWIYFKSGETDKAVGYLERASQLLLDPVILNHLAEAYQKQGKLKEAKERWTTSLKLDPTQKDVRETLKKL